MYTISQNMCLWKATKEELGTNNGGILLQIKSIPMSYLMAVVN